MKKIVGMIPSFINGLSGIALIAAPDIFHFYGKDADNLHICGPLIGAFGIISIWGVTRPVNHFNFLIAAWVIIAPLILNYSNIASLLCSLIIGFIVMLFASFKTSRFHKYGGGWKSLFKE